MSGKEGANEKREIDLVHLFNNKKETVIVTLMATYSIELAYHNFLT